MSERITKVNQDLVDHIEDLNAKIQYLAGGCEDGMFTFPDGDYWLVSKKPSVGGLNDE